MRRRYIPLAIAAGLSVASAASLPERGGPEDDIAKTERKLRDVRLSYDWTGRSLQQCRVERSSGDPDIDRTMCRILRTCVKQGSSSTTEAQRWRKRRVETLIAEAQRLGMPRIPPVTDEVPDESGAATAQADASNDAPHTAAQDGDIVVEGRRNPIRGGLWQIERTTIFREGGAGEMPQSNPHRFDICLPDTSVRQMLERAVNERLRRPGMNDCGPINFAMDSKFANLRFTCSGGSGETVLASLAGKHEVSLVYGRAKRDKRWRPRDDAITAVHSIELNRRGSAATFRRRSTGALARYVMYSNATRVGDCSLSGGPDRLPVTR